MSNQILDTDSQLHYTLGENYPKATKYFIAERRYEKTTWDINLDLNFDSLAAACTDRDWWAYCEKQYWTNFLDDYLHEYGEIPVCVVECNADGLIKKYMLHPREGCDKYFATEYIEDKQLLQAASQKGLVNILY